MTSNYIAEYYDAILNGKVNVGKYIKLIYEYILDGLQKGIFFYDDKKARRSIKFIENFCHHCEGRHDLIKLELWEKAFISVVFGIVDKDNYRQFREIILVIGRKNGKSLLASAITALMVYADGEYGAKAYCLAPKLEQATIVYDNFYQMVLKEPELADMAKKRRSDIYIEYSNSVIKPLAFNAKKSDGFNPHLVTCDEIASWSGDAGLKQYDVMKSALGARKQPMILSITTAGFVNGSIYDELLRRSTQFLLGTAKEKETRLLPILYIIDDEEKWDDIEELKKSNPNMGVSVSEQYFRDEIVIAKNSLAKQAEFKVKYCNLKQSSQCAWLMAKQIEQCFGQEMQLSDFRSCYCVGGIDLSQTTDLTAASVIIEKGGILYDFTQFFMPEKRVDELSAKDGKPYRLFVERGWLTLSGENYVDYNDVMKWFVMLVQEYEILPLWVGYDRYSAQYLVQQMEGYGFHMDDVVQGENLTPVLREFEGIINDGKMQGGTNDLLKAHFYDVGIAQNLQTRRIRPVKINPVCHIDGFVSVIDALTVRQKYYEQIGEQLKNEG